LPVIRESQVAPNQNVKETVIIKETPKEDKMIIDTCSKEYKEELELLFRESTLAKPG
jgi:hypothetical protein